MKILVLSLLLLALFALVAGWLRNVYNRRRLRRGEIDEMPAVQPARPDGCCGQHEVCEKDSMLAAVSKEIEYYDDEELDAYCRRPSNAYTPEEAEAFREVLYTMRETEVAGWGRSLTLRGIELPDEVKDEVLLIVGERRGQ